MSVDTLRAAMEAWPVEWRWEGRSGHPRRIADSVAGALHDLGFAVESAEAPLARGQLGGGSEFEGAIVARQRQTGLAALRRKWIAALFGLLLVPVIVGIFMIAYALRGRERMLGVSWRGEAYGDSAGTVVSDLRITVRCAVVDAGRSAAATADLRPAVAQLGANLAASLAGLAPQAPPPVANSLEARPPDPPEPPPFAPFDSGEPPEEPPSPVIRRPGA